MNRLNISNGYQARVSPDGKYVTSSNVECLLTLLDRQGEGVAAVATRTLSKPGEGQSYSGWWLSRYVLRFVQDAAANDRRQYVHDTRTGVTSQGPNAQYFNDTMARDGHTADSIPGIYYDGLLWPDSMNRPPDDQWGPLRICEGSSANTEKNNRSMVVRSPSGIIAGRFDQSVFITNYCFGPEGWVVFHKEGDPRLWAWQPGMTEPRDVTVQPIGPNSPWGEGLGWLWRRENGDIWLATWVTMQPSGTTYVLVRPLLATPADFCLWRAFGGITDISAAEDPDGFLIVVGSFNADAFATAFAPGSSMTKFNPDAGTGGGNGGGGGNGDTEVTKEECAAIVKASEARVIDHMNVQFAALQKRCNQLEELGRAQRDTTVNLFGTREGTIKRNDTPVK